MEQEQASSVQIMLVSVFLVCILFKAFIPVPSLMLPSTLKFSLFLAGTGSYLLKKAMDIIQNDLRDLSPMTSLITYAEEVTEQSLLVQRENLAFFSPSVRPPSRLPSQFTCQGP